MMKSSTNIYKCNNYNVYSEVDTDNIEDVIAYFNEKTVRSKSPLMGYTSEITYAIKIIYTDGHETRVEYDWFEKKESRTDYWNLRSFINKVNKN